MSKIDRFSHLASCISPGGRVLEEVSSLWIGILRPEASAAGRHPVIDQRSLVQTSSKVNLPTLLRNMVIADWYVKTVYV